MFCVRFAAVGFAVRCCCCPLGVGWWVWLLSTSVVVVFGWLALPPVGRWEPGGWGQGGPWPGRCGVGCQARPLCDGGWWGYSRSCVWGSACGSWCAGWSAVVFTGAAAVVWWSRGGVGDRLPWARGQVVVWPLPCLVGRGWRGEVVGLPHPVPLVPGEWSVCSAAVPSAGGAGAGLVGVTAGA